MPMPTSASVIGSGALPVTVIAYANGPVAKPHAGQAMLCRRIGETDSGTP